MIEPGMKFAGFQWKCIYCLAREGNGAIRVKSHQTFEKHPRMIVLRPKYTAS